MARLKVKGKKSKFLRDERGYTFAFAVGVAVILMLVGANLLNLIVDESQMYLKYQDSTWAYYIAEAGINHALWNLNNGYSAVISSETTPTAFGGGSYYTKYDSDTKTLVSTGKYNNLTRTISTGLEVGEKPASFGRAVSGTQFNAIPGDNLAAGDDPYKYNYVGVFIRNHTTDTAKPVVMSAGGSALVIHGYVVNDLYDKSDPNFLGYAWCDKGINPTDKKYNPPGTVYPAAHWKEATLAGEPGLPTFDTSYYEGLIQTASTTGTAGNVTWSSEVSFDPGTYYYRDNLTISGGSVLNKNPSVGPVVIVVFRKLTIENASTIGNNIRFVCGGGWVNNESKLKTSLALYMAGNNKTYCTILGDETQFYSNGQTEIHDYVATVGKRTTPDDPADDGEAIIFSRYLTSIASDKDSAADPSGYHVDLQGIIFSRERIELTNATNGGNIRITGCLVAGDEGSVYEAGEGKVHFPAVNHRIDLIFDRGVVDEGVSDFPDAFKIIEGVIIDYSRWRER